MELQGTIKLINPTETVGANGFRKRLLVLSSHEAYPQSIPIDFVQDKVDILNNYQPGQEVKIGINIRGNEYQGKYYCNIQGWKIEALTPAGQQQAPSQGYQAPAQQYPNDAPTDDLPF